jgi:hypothetical protein
MKRRLVLTVLTVLTVLLAGPGPVPVACALELCASHTGKVAARPSCRRKERMLDRAALGLVGADAQGTAGPGVRILDRDGRAFGSNAVEGILAGNSVLVSAGSFFVSVVVDGIARPQTTFFTHEQPGCQGPRYIGTEPTAFVRPATSTNPPYYAADPIGSHTEASNEFTDYDPTLCASQSGTVIGTSCCFTGSGMANNFLGPATPVDVSSVALPLRVVVSP